MVSRSLSLDRAWQIGAIMEAGYRLLGLQSEPRMTRFLAAQLGRSHWFDISRAVRDLGYQPQVSMAAGLEQLLPELTAATTGR